MRLECSERFMSIENELKDFTDMKRDIHEMKGALKTIKNFAWGAAAMWLVTNLGLIETIKLFLKG